MSKPRGSIIEDLRDAGIVVPTSVIEQTRAASKELKAERRTTDRQARKILIAHYLNRGRKWDSAQNRRMFRALMKRRQEMSRRIYRLGGEKKEKEFDSP